jgi:NADH dehydrogenase
LIEAHNELQDGMGAEQRFRLEISIVEAAPRILGGLPEKISDQATTALERKGVKVRPAPRSSRSIPIDWRPASATSRPT